MFDFLIGRFLPIFRTNGLLGGYGTQACFLVYANLGRSSRQLSTFLEHPLPHCKTNANEQPKQKYGLTTLTAFSPRPTFVEPPAPADTDDCALLLASSAL